MKICNLYLVLFCLTLGVSLYAEGGTYRYIKGSSAFEIMETASEYEVTCIRSGVASSSRNRNILDRQLRMDAVDLIGAYIVYTNSGYATGLGSEYFQIFADGINLHYEAVLTGLKHKSRISGGKAIICYTCDKSDYRMEYASYDKDIDFQKLVEAYYLKNKDIHSAKLLYDFKGFTSARYLELEADFLTGRVRLPEGFRAIQAQQDRFEKSLFSESHSLPQKIAAPDTLSLPFRSFALEDLVTSSPFRQKAKYYKLWRQSLNAGDSVYEKILVFCAEKCLDDPKKTELCISSAIAAFTGAISPFGIREPINDSLYFRAAEAYSKSDFASSVTLLTESVDNEGISAKQLNLLGASYRYLGKPEKALPFLLLCLKLNPETEFLAGNLALCLNQAGFSMEKQTLEFLELYAKDDWSKNEINNLKTTIL